MRIANKYSTGILAINNDVRIQSIQGDTNLPVSYNINGKSINTTFNAGGTTGDATGQNYFYVGGSPANKGLVDVAEVIIYPSDLSNGQTDQIQKNRIESYLALKYGITLDQTIGTPINYVNSFGTTIWNSNTNFTYKNNIAGIGKDDMGGATNSGLLQKQSQSANLGDQIVMALGTMSATQTNKGNLTNFSVTDKQFIIWGDNNENGITTYIPTSNNYGIYSSSNKIWRAESVNFNSGQVQVLIPNSFFGNGTIVNPKLLS